MSKLSVGLIGAGGIAKEHIEGWNALGAQVSVYSEEGAPALTERFGGTVVDDLDALLAVCDLVDVVTPTSSHKEYALAALAAGKDVICEKPLARTHADAVELATAAAAAGRHLYPAHVVRYFPDYYAMRQAALGGALGDLAVLRFTRTSSFPSAKWFADEEQSGGVVMDLMIHDLDIARWVAGEVREVYATSVLDLTDGVRTCVATAVLTHASGAISNVRGVWGPALTTFATSFDIAGNQGRLEYDSLTQQQAVIRVDGGGAAPAGDLLPDLSYIESPYTAELRSFTRAITEGARTRVDAADGVIAVDLALACLDSIATGQPVPFATWDGAK